jgi:hypothetical protein
VGPRRTWDPSVGWEADFSSPLKQRLGKAMREFDGNPTPRSDGCPDIWELENGDFAVIGRDATAAYRARLPNGVTIRHDECLSIVPRFMLIAAKPDIPDA